MYDWLSFFDIDGYLQLIQPNLKIQHFLNNYKTNNSLYYENKSLIKWANIPNFNISVNLHIKSTVRGNLSKNYWSKADTPHTSLNNLNCSKSSWKYINYTSNYNL